ncbi:bacteriorhodopsin [Natrialba sp. INN-245]|uniref:bacteriorhodopsin n=1 Tax=Natrialba sp. INN-245 TaxID=2690967 RepID=UPI001311215F|nr:bacteriorhodopsin [Natrialba sp. INN-245]
MIDTTTLFWFGALGMGAGTAAFVRGSLSGDTSDSRYYAILAAVSLIAAIAYALMALGIGWLPVGDRIVFVPRYVDWLLTTPLLLAFLGLLSGIGRRELGLVVAVNTVVMGGGLAAALLSGAARFWLFGLAAAAYVALVYLLLGPMSEQASERGPAVGSLFGSLRNLTVVLWSVYPIVWLLGPPGFDLLTLTVDVMLVTYLDLLTKVGFGLIALNAGATIETELGASVPAESSRPS